MSIYFDPVTLEFNGGERIELSRLNDIVTAIVFPRQDSVRMNPAVQPLPQQFGITGGTATFFTQPDDAAPSWQLQLAEQGSPIILPFGAFGTVGPYSPSPATFKWVADPVTNPPGTGPQLILPGDYEQMLIDELNVQGLLDVGTSIPMDPKPDQFTRILRVGGSERDLVTDEPLFTIETFALTESAAIETANLIIALLKLVVRQTGRLGGTPCYGLQVVSLPQNYPLPSVPTHKRYTTTIAPALRRTVVNL